MYEQEWYDTGLAKKFIQTLQKNPNEPSGQPNKNLSKV